jgi:predicted PurR-regulated permease PerM
MLKKYIENLDRKYLKICAYGIVSALIIFICGLIILKSSPFFLNLWTIITAVLKPLILGLLLCYLVTPVTDYIESKLKFKSGTSRIIAVIITIAIALLIVAGIILLLYFTLSKNIGNINIASLQELYTYLEAEFKVYFSGLQSLISNGDFSMPSLSDVASSTVADIKNTATTLLFSIVFAVHFLLDGKNILAYWNRLYNVTVGKEMQAKIRVWLDEANTCFSGYIRGQFIDALTVGLLCSVALSLLGVPYALVVGMLTGFGNLIPYLGGVMGFGSLAISCLITGDFQAFIIGAITISVIMAVDSNIINPKLLSANINVHPMLVVASLIAGGAVGGLLGMLIAVPTGAFLKLQVDHYIERKEREKQAAESA